jgi:hypothetical protein
VTAAGLGLRPFAPAHLRVEREDADLRFSWVRTTRIGGDNLNAVEVPLAEEREIYRVTVRSAEETLRRADVTEPRFDYTSAMQAEDGASGPIQIGVAQLSATVGYGPERVIEINA